MSFLKDEAGQGAAEYILLFGGVIVIAIAALVIYRTYFTNASGLDAGTDVNQVRENMN
jgi:Flp pilus assembly pilin Flp